MADQVSLADEDLAYFAGLVGSGADEEADPTSGEKQSPSKSPGSDSEAAALMQLSRGSGTADRPSRDDDKLSSPPGDMNGILTVPGSEGNSKPSALEPLDMVEDCFDTTKEALDWLPDEDNPDYCAKESTELVDPEYISEWPGTASQQFSALVDAGPDVHGRMESTILDQQDPATDDLNTKRFLAQPKSAMEPQMIPYKVISKRRLESVLDKKFPKGDYHVSIIQDVYHIEAPSHLTKKEVLGKDLYRWTPPWLRLGTSI